MPVVRVSARDVRKRNIFGRKASDAVRDRGTDQLPAVQATLKPEPPAVSGPGVARTLVKLESNISTGSFENAEIGPLVAPPVAAALVNAAFPKSDRVEREPLTSGRSTIHSADDCCGAGEGDAMSVLYVQFVVVSLIASVQVEPARLTEAVIASPGATG